MQRLQASRWQLSGRLQLFGTLCIRRFGQHCSLRRSELFSSRTNGWYYVVKLECQCGTFDQCLRYTASAFRGIRRINNPECCYLCTSTLCCYSAAQARRKKTRVYVEYDGVSMMIDKWTHLSSICNSLSTKNNTLTIFLSHC